MDAKEKVTVSVPGDWAGVAFVVCGFLLIVLTLGEPDLLDEIIARTMP
jgi:hypothetical protein